MFVTYGAPNANFLNMQQGFLKNVRVLCTPNMIIVCVYVAINGTRVVILLTK